MGGGILGSRQKRKGSACAGPFWFFIPVATDSADRCERRGGSELGFAAASWRWPRQGDSLDSGCGLRQAHSVSG